MSKREPSVLKRVASIALSMFSISIHMHPHDSTPPPPFITPSISSKHPGLFPTSTYFPKFNAYRAKSHQLIWGLPPFSFQLNQYWHFHFYKTSSAVFLILAMFPRKETYVQQTKWKYFQFHFRFVYCPQNGHSRFIS